MAKITIDTSLCKQCGTCVQLCPMEVFKQNGKGDEVIVVNDELCIACGHCLAGCAQKAHIHSEVDRSRIILVDKEAIPTYNNVMELLKSRRSVRNYKSVPVEREKIQQIIEAARFAPSAENFQSTKYRVVHDRAKIDEVVASCIKVLEQDNQLKREQLKKQKYEEVLATSIKNVDVILKAFKNGKDRLSFDTPVMIFFYSQIGISYSEVNANLALQNAMLAAHSLGLGSFYTGYIVACCKKDQSIQKLIGIPEGYAVYGALAVGYPKIKLRNYINKNKPDIIWN